MARLFIPSVLASATLLMALPAAAQETVPVLDARPFHQNVVETRPQQVCETRRGGFLGDRTGQIVGGVAGGFLGSEIGSGTGRKAATVAGALIGAEAGRRYIGQPTTHCHIAEQRIERQEVAGYDVIYEQDGRLWRTRTVDHPGDTITVPARRTLSTR